MIKEIIESQKRELQQKLAKGYIPRKIESKGGPDDIRIIIGPRKSGKAFFGIHQLINGQSFAYLSFEDTRLVNTVEIDKIIEAALTIYSSPKIILFDEIQYFPGWELVVNRLQRKGYQLILTSSNSNILNQGSSAQLSLRHEIIHLSTFSYSEYLTIDKTENSLSNKRQKFNDFISSSAYPEPLMQNHNNNEYLQVLLDSILFRDIIKRHNIRQSLALEDLCIFLISNNSQEYSMNYLSRELNISSVHTVKKYLAYLEEAFVIFSLPRYSTKESDIGKVTKKYYCCDNGLYIAKAHFTSEGFNILLKNSIAIQLHKGCLNNDKNLFFWKGRDKDEVDFIIQDGDTIIELVQVCHDVKNQRVLERKVRPLLKASQKLNCKNLLIITMDEDFSREYKWFGFKEEVQFTPVWKWMIE